MHWSIHIKEAVTIRTDSEVTASFCVILLRIAMPPIPCGTELDIKYIMKLSNTFKYVNILKVNNYALQAQEINIGASVYKS